jgi:hypothetical protein
MSSSFTRGIPSSQQLASITRTTSSSSNSGSRTIVERTPLHNNVINYIKRTLPRPNKNGELVVRKENFKQLEFRIDGKNKDKRDRSKLVTKYVKNVFEDFPTLPVIPIPRREYGQLYIDHTVSFPEEDVQRIFLEINDILLLVPEVSCRYFMHQNAKYKKESGVLCCCPKCNSNKYVEPIGFAQNTFMVYGIDRVYNALSYKYKCTNVNCKVKVKPKKKSSSTSLTQRLSAGVNRLADYFNISEIRQDYVFTATDILENFPSLSVLVQKLQRSNKYKYKGH